MQRRKEKNNRRFRYTPGQSLPRLPRIKTEWDLSGLYYKNERDPRIEQDLAAAEAAYEAFARKWRTKDFIRSERTLFAALTEYEALAGNAALSRPGRYFGFRSVLNAKDEVADKRMALIGERLRKASDKILFFTLTLGALPKAKQRALLRAKTLSRFRYHLERVFLAAKHHLTEPEERIINLKAAQSSGRWVEMTDKLIANRTIRWQGKDVHIPEALELIDQLQPKDKRRIWALIMREMRQIGEVAEHEFNALITDVRTEDDVRGYEKPYSATALSYEDSERSIERLVHAVSTKGFELSRSFYKLKAKYHGVDTLHYTQKYDPIGAAPEIPFEQAVEICRDVFYGLKPLYGEIFDTMLTRGQIDVYPRKGKRGGAFMSAAVGHPVHVFLNHTSTMKALETLAHEMGHAIHAHRSATQSPLYAGHSTTTAETASTLFENLLFDAVYAQANDRDRTTLLHDRITRDISTIERQIAFFNCELAIHTTIKEQGGMTNVELARTMQKHLASYLGPAVTVDEDDGYSYVYIPHLRYGFYVYTYAFGILMSTLMANEYKEDSRYIEKIDEFLCAGESDTVANIFRKIGIDTEREDTFLNALDNHKRDIQTLSKLLQ